MESTLHTTCGTCTILYTYLYSVHWEWFSDMQCYVVASWVDNLSTVDNCKECGMAKLTSEKQTLFDSGQWTRPMVPMQIFNALYNRFRRVCSGGLTVCVASCMHAHCYNNNNICMCGIIHHQKNYELYLQKGLVLKHCILGSQFTMRIQKHYCIACR